MGRPPFYLDGIQFECQGSGRCCTSRGTYGFVYLTKEDQKRYAQFFKLTTAQFIKQYCHQKNGYVFLKDPKDFPAEKAGEMKDGDCIFLKDNRCTTYEARPQQCRTWPFWPENMNARTWNKEIAEYCPGVGKGKLYTREEIKKILDSQEQI